MPFKTGDIVRYHRDLGVLHVFGRNCSKVVHHGTVTGTAEDASGEQAVTVELDCGLIQVLLSSELELDEGTPGESSTPVADALAEVDKAMADGFTEQGEARPHLSRALWQLAEAVRASLTTFSETDVRALAVTAEDLRKDSAVKQYMSPQQIKVLNRARLVFGTRERTEHE
jgi:hypothetical protein